MEINILPLTSENYELVQDIPGMEDKPHPDYEQMNNLLKDFDKNGFLLATDGEQWVALSMILKETADCFYNSMTGVVREYRGKGLALAMKLRAIEYARNNGAKYIRTHNYSKNKSMLALNEKLGYKPTSGIYTLIKGINNLAINN